jgi:hypothetical protein
VDGGLRSEIRDRLRLVDFGHKARFADASLTNDGDDTTNATLQPIFRWNAALSHRCLQLIRLGV